MKRSCENPPFSLAKETKTEVCNEKNYMGGAILFFAAGIKALPKMRQEHEIFLFKEIPRQCPAANSGCLAYL